ncbi:hypothetical protein [Pengzhenrongella sp.]|jgi:hypothetical protein|uniref:hypothetical protein n=1 Tax=Pengzhenrongella sp. TaxID=2888820 RepID=UPI002F92EEE9
MTTTWIEPAAVLSAEASGWEGVWTLVFAAGHAAVNLASVPGADDDLGLTYAALDTSYALTELEQRLVDFTAPGVAVDVGPVSLADRDAAVDVIDELLAAAQALTNELAGRPGAGVLVVLCSTRVSTLLESARAKATGGAW